MTRFPLQASVLSVWIFVLTWMAISPCRADVTLPAIFSGHMVLQKSSEVPVWGKADPGEKVAVTLGIARAETHADANGKWRLSLDLSQAGTEAGTMTVTGNNSIAIPDVLVGEVWLCSGQSNMEFPLSRSAVADTEIAAASNPGLRQFRVKRHTAREPKENCEGHWVEASPATAGAFSAVAYYFGKKLRGTLDAPVGLITAAVGATPSEGWTSNDALSTDPDLKSGTDRDLAYALAYPETKKAYVEAYQAWGAHHECSVMDLSQSGFRIRPLATAPSASATNSTGSGGAKGPGNPSRAFHSPALLPRLSP